MYRLISVTDLVCSPSRIMIIYHCSKLHILIQFLVDGCGYPDWLLQLADIVTDELEKKYGGYELIKRPGESEYSHSVPYGVQPS